MSATKKSIHHTITKEANLFKCPECDQEYNNLLSLNRHYTSGHKKKSINLYKTLIGSACCECGCGKEPHFKSITKGFQKYIHGHNNASKIKCDKSIEKFCPKCEKVLPLISFGKRKDKQRYQSYCHKCSFEYRKKNRDLANKRAKLWYEKNKDQVIKKMQERFHADIDYRLILNCRRYVNQKIKQNVIPAKKSNKTLELLGCTTQELREHLEKQFEDGMTWDNYGPNWHIDHIIACSLFDFSDPSQQKECFHFSNLKPMWASQNISKGNKIVDKEITIEERSILVNGHKITKYMLEKMSYIEREELTEKLIEFCNKNDLSYLDYV